MMVVRALQSVQWLPKSNLLDSKTKEPSVAQIIKPLIQQKSEIWFVLKSATALSEGIHVSPCVCI